MTRWESIQYYQKFNLLLDDQGSCEPDCYGRNYGQIQGPTLCRIMM
jgi:hypothetical protein